MTPPGLVALVSCTMFGLAPPTRAFAAEERTGRGSVERELQMMDEDGDGRISAEEHAAGARRMFETMDANGNGKVTAAEMDAAHEKVTGRKARKGEPSAADKIAVIDADGDGTLSAREHADGARAMFQKMDADANGFLVEAELAAGHEKLMPKPRK
jgi:Ca2+-binding EF-hand superfamily protein